MSQIIQLRHDTAANWTSVNPILALGEVGLDSDTGNIKIGDGSTHWNTLSYKVFNIKGDKGDQGTGINRTATTTINFGNEDTYVEQIVLDAAITTSNNILAFTYDADFIMQKVEIRATNIQNGVGYTLCAIAPDGASGIMNVTILII